MASGSSQTMSLKILVEKEKNQIVFVEANKDFVDVLFSFLTIPIGTIVRLTREHSLNGEIGCLNNLYDSLEKLDEDFLSSERKGIVLHPRCATDVYRNLKVNLAECNKSKYYVCDSCDTVCQYRYDSCTCGEAFHYEVNLVDPVANGGSGFVKSTVRFMITDDLQVWPMSTVAGLSLLGNFGALDGSKIEERLLSVGKDEVLKLLKCSLTSSTPFSDSMLEPPFSKKKCRINYGLLALSMMESEDYADTRNKDEKINLKLVINRSKNRALYAEVEENFVNLLCRFLSLPIGYILNECVCLPFKGCLVNLYRSVHNLDVSKFFISEKMKAILLDPKLAPGTPCANKLIGIEEAEYLSYSTLSSEFKTSSPTRLSSKSPLRKVKIGGGLVKGPSAFMVTDSLSVAPLSPISGISLINKLNIPLSDIQELEVNMGEEESLRLLVASLVSSSALTDAFLLKKDEARNLR